MARPKKKIDVEQLKKLAMLHLSDRVISDILGISEDTLHRRYADQIKVWQSESKSKMAAILFDEALNKRKEYAIKGVTRKHLKYFEGESDVEGDSKNVSVSISYDPKRLKDETKE